jgi:hypothetical protein
MWIALEKKYVRYAMRMIRQLSVLGIRLTYVNLSISDAPIPTMTPMNRLPKKTPKKMPKASNKLTMPSVSALSLYLWAVSNRTMATASLRMDSPNMIVYSFGSTLYVSKMARMVTGSVADKVAPTDMASTKLIWKPSRDSRVQRKSIIPRTSADMNVPAKAKVRIAPICLKKFPC